ncbi:MAG: recombination protein RecR [Firmicutes bacterium]|jgi:recombination protein RecR|nr:recombination protein RecR [Bacillota bacterium]HQD40716.1 recombination mediator RecR [Bacillota bacterium]
MAVFPQPLQRLMEELNKLPGIGSKSAQRIAFHILQAPKEEVSALAEALVAAKQKIGYCSNCFNITDRDPCRLCQDPRREDNVICVVEDPRDVVALEKTNFKGRYHVLGGAISPLEGVGPEQLRIKELLERLKKQPVEELILATNPTLEGEATAMYLARLLRGVVPSITRIAHGLPVGGDLEYVDEMTLTKALEGRHQI